MDIGSSNYFSVSASTNKGVSGLISGMDTESMVKQMLSGTQGQIDKQQGLKTQAEWRQEIYRDMITSINGFKDKYFDTSYGSELKTNFASSKFFNSMNSTVSGGGAVKVLSTDSTATVGDIDVLVKQLAATGSIKSNQRMSGDILQVKGKAVTEKNLAAFEKKVSFTVDYKDEESNTAGIKKIEVNLNNVSTEADMVKAFNAQLVGTGMEAKIFDGRLRLIGGKEANISGITGTALGMKMAGFSRITAADVKNDSNEVIGKMFQGGVVDTASGTTFEMTLDGVTKSITLNPSMELAPKLDADGTPVLDTDGNPVMVDKVTMNTLTAALEKEVSRAFGDSVKVDRLNADGKPAGSGEEIVSFALRLNVNNNNGTPEMGHQLTVTGVDANKIGIPPGSSSSLSSDTQLKKLLENAVDSNYNPISSGIQGDRYSFSINGFDFSFNQYDSVSVMMNNINNSNAGVRMSYSAMSDTFSLESTSTGSKYGLNIKQTEGNLLNVLFGSEVNAASTVVGKEITTKSVISKTGGLATEFGTSNGSMSMNVNGEAYTWTLDYKRDAEGTIKVDSDKNPVKHTKEEIETAFNNWLTATFGHDTPNLDPNGKPIKEAEITYADGKLSVADGYEHAIRFTQTKVDLEDPKAVKDAALSDLGLAFGFTKTNATNVASADTNISDIPSLSGWTFTKADGTAATKLGEIAVASNNGDFTGSVTFSNGRFTRTNPGGGDTFLPKELFGLDVNTTVTVGSGVATNKKGADAIVSINGVDTTRNSNTFTIDGITMQATALSPFTNEQVKNPDGTPKLDADSNPIMEKVYKSSDKTTINTVRDIEKIVDGFKSFIEDYNKLLGKLNGLVDEKATFRSYPPLTADQKKEMSENEVELWDKKAKEGLLRRDSDTDTFLSQMRNALYTKPAGAKLALFDIGIETGQYKDKGKLQLNESTLRNAIASDPDSVMKLFTAAEDGISTQLMRIIKNTANLSAADPGSLVQMAGVEGWSSETNNTMTHKIIGIKDKIKQLQVRYEKERQRYWNQFNSMEKIMSDFNSQSGFLSQQFA